MKKDLLFLTHRIPFPPNKGDKIRSYNLLKHLSHDYRIHLGTFIDDPADWVHLDEVRALCAETRFLDLNPRWSKLRSLRGLLTREPLTLPYYRHPAMQSWVDEILSRPAVERVLVFSAAMAQYVGNPAGRKLHKVIDFVDVDSEKWRAYGERKPWPLSWLYRREGRTLLNYERTIATQFDAGVFVSAAEAALFRQLTPEVATPVTYVNNGVDTEYFHPGYDYPNPYRADQKVLVFTGAMDYWANVDAVCWFAREVFPEVRDKIPEAGFFIVGARPTEAVCRLDRLSGVQVTGAVQDIRPYLAHACAAVAPMRIARGIQNKVLEAMAMGKPVLATPAAMEGIRLDPELESLMADRPESLAEKTIELLLQGDGTGLGRRGRECVVAHYSWMENLRRFEELLEWDGMNPQDYRFLTDGHRLGENTIGSGQTVC